MQLLAPSIWLVWLLFLSSGVQGQELPPEQPKGRFLRQTVRVGEIISYELTFRHDPTLEVVFPDSTAEFKPFEYVGKTFQPTLTRRGRSFDRTVYQLRTFSLDSLQRLSLPVMILRGHDTLTVNTSAASIRLVRTAPVPEVIPPTTPVLKQNTTLLPVDVAFNYPFWLAGLGIAVLVGAGLWFGFGSYWRRRYQLYKLRKNHAYFLAQYARHIERFELSRSLTNMERAITLWKNYLTTLENNTINSLTTREIVAYYQNDVSVSRALRITDRLIYGNQFNEDDTETSTAFDLLRDFADRRYTLLSGVAGS
ncbi:hypothetical protein H8B13_00600 [Hymenobacter sp. BT188]|uniref:hypothetical protein n=1 Tax=Hymenobacter sp. BT188 TaxID=2763504 RepID=UPI001651984B|nr:hypothetical protein [Hymenobacter sp. BT188]MBC6605307.1 hypothetical protein [Hymenobacter sp. BT188]